METSVMLFRRVSDRSVRLEKAIPLGGTEEALDMSGSSVRLRVRARKESTPETIGMSVRQAIGSVMDRSCRIRADQLSVDRLIGAGQFGMVFKGAWLDQVCAVKTLRPGVSSDSVEYERLLAEVTVLSGVGAHPNIVRFYGAVVEEMGTPLLVCEYVDGVDLEEYLSRKSLGFNLGRAKVGALCDG